MTDSTPEMPLRSLGSPGALTPLVTWRDVVAWSVFGLAMVWLVVCAAAGYAFPA